MEVVGEVGNGRLRGRAARPLAPKPHVVVLDLSMPEMNGLAATRALLEPSPSVAVVALTRHSDDAYVQALLGAGASGYVLKQSDAGRAAAARSARPRRAERVSRPVAGGPRRRRVHGAPRARRRAAPRITDRETEVLRLMAVGHSNKEIAARSRSASRPSKCTRRTRCGSSACAAASTSSATRCCRAGCRIPESLPVFGHNP